MRAIPLRHSMVHLGVPAPLRAWVRRAASRVAGFRERLRTREWPRDIAWLLLVAVGFAIRFWVLWTGSVNRRH